MERTDYLKAKIRIGNCKGPVSYNLTQTVFHHDDIPDDRRQRHSEIKHWLKSKVLSEEKAGWKKSTDPGNPVCVRRTMENFANDRSNSYQYNYRAENLDCLRTTHLIDKPTKLHVSTQLESTALAIRKEMESNRVKGGNFNRTGEMPSHPKLDDSLPWKVSTFLNTKDVNQQLDTITNKATSWTRQVNGSSQMVAKHTGPYKAAILLQNEIRKQKLEGTFSTDKQVNRPRTEPVDRKKLRNRFALEKLNKQSFHQHSGVWEPSKIDGRYMWSDTGSSDYNSKGDVTRTVNLDSYNLEGPNFINKKLPPVTNNGRTSPYPNN